MKTIIFDFDGTIADSFATLVGIFEEITSRKQKLKPKEIESLRGQPLKGILKHLKIKKWQIPSLLIKGKRAMAIKITKIKPFDGLPQVLKKLHDEGYQMFILSTNSSENISTFLKTNDMHSYFRRIYGDIGLRSKSSALRKVMKKEHVRRSECVYIGDEVRDVEAAKKAGITHISVGWGFNYPETLKNAQPTALASQPPELITILKRLGGPTKDLI